MRYHVGDDAKITAVFRVDRVETNPTAVFADIYAPGDTVPTTVTYPAATLTRPSTGTYELVVDCTEAGRWRIVWRSTGTAKAAEPFYFNVEETPEAE